MSPRTVVLAWSATNPDPIAVRAGDRLRLDGRTDVWDGHDWVWAAGPDGREGWVPDSLVVRDGDGARAGADFDARELTCAAGASVTIHAQTHGWALAEAADGRRGWIPLAHLALPVEAAP